MRYLIYDLDTATPELEELAGDDLTILNAAHPAAKCVGCFRCWLKTPGRCTFSDQLQHIGSKLMTSEEIILVCQSLYGGFSINMKRLLDRVIPGVLPFFIKKNDELHHSQRYCANPALRVIFYNANEMTEGEKQQAEKMVAAVALNFSAEKHQVTFVESPTQILAEVTA